MKMRRPIPYINEEVSNRDLKYYIFDWDDNILHMPTRIKMEHRDTVDSHKRSGKAGVRSIIIYFFPRFTAE